MRISVNGKERSFDLHAESFGEFLQQVRTACTSSSSCISSVRVDGIEVALTDGGELARVPLAEIRQVEIFTAHPRELAEETLQNLRAFSEHLVILSRQVAQEFLASPATPIEFAKLIDGIQMFTEALEGVKQLLGLRQKGIAPVLEADLLSILKDLLTYYQQGQNSYVAELLSTHLPENLEEWRTKAIPALIRSRDS